MNSNVDEILGDLDNTINQKVQELLGASEVPTGPIFHYTTVAGLKGILESKHIFAIHIMYLNDLSELTYGASIGGDILREELERERTILMEGVKGIVADASIIDKSSAHSALEMSRGKAFRVINKAVQLLDSWPQNDRYITSFCESGDLLSQWRGYADQGGGYAIGFSVTSSWMKTENGFFGAFKMVYDPERQRGILSHILALIMKKLEALPFPESDNNDYDYIISQCAYRLTGYFRLIDMRFKNAAFSEESEWRFYTEIDAGDCESVKFRVAKGSLIPYMELPVIAEGIKIEKIVCGPTLHPDLSRRSVEMLARKNGFSALDIATSKIPLSSR